MQPKGGESLRAILRSTRRAAGRARRVRVLLLVADGTRLRQIQAQTGMSPRRVQHCRRCWQQQGLDGLRDAPRSGRPKNLTPQKEAAILAATEKPPPGLLTHGSSRRLACQLGVSCGTVVRVGHRVGLQPHRLRRYRANPDPDFEAKAKDILGLYLDPPKHAAVVCVDERTAIQALDRSQSALPLRRGQPERQAVEYVRHRPVSLFPSPHQPRVFDFSGNETVD